MRRLIGVALSALMLGSCSKHASTDWKEEVLLSSGEIITVKRAAAANAFRELGGPSGVRKLLMKVTVESSKTAPLPPPLEFSFVPLVFDYDVARKEWFVVATFYMCDVWYELGKPSLPYLEYRVRNGQWQRVPLGPENFGRKANMLIIIDLEGEREFVTNEWKQEQNKEAGDSKRTILPEWHTAC